MTREQNLTCPTCEKRFRREASDAMPFCRRRCRQIDLGRWLAESYSFPSLRISEDELERRMVEDLSEADGG